MASWLALLLVLQATPSETPTTGRKALRAEAESILDGVQSLELTPREARTRVELLLRALRSWAEESGIELSPNSRTYGSTAKDGEQLTAERCPLFFKEDIEEEEDVCPLDLTRSEVWGGSVLFCRYQCAPALEPD